MLGCCQAKESLFASIFWAALPFGSEAARIAINCIAAADEGMASQASLARGYVQLDQLLGGLQPSMRRGNLEEPELERLPHPQPWPGKTNSAKEWQAGQCSARLLGWIFLLVKFKPAPSLRRRPLPPSHPSMIALANLIALFVDRLKPLAEKPPAGFLDETRAQLWHAYAAGEARLGEEHGDNARLASAIAFYKKTLSIWTRDKVPLQWATTQNNLGTALSTLGERESGTARLEEAVSAYRAALQERTREKVPLDWAMTQNNLANALRALGARESATVRLEEAVAAYRAALQERTRDKVPLDWAMTQNNLGNAFWSLGEREAETDKAKGCATLKTARDHYAAALEEFRRAGTSYYVEGAQRNVARLDGVIARVCG